MRIKQATKQGWIEWPVGAIADCSYQTSKHRRARVQEDVRVCHTLQANEKDLLYFEDDRGGYNMIDYRIRRLTPRECWRLMDFTDEDYDKVKDKVSATQQYKQAGNSIVVNCLVGILGQLFEGHEEDYKKFANTGAKIETKVE